MPIADWLGMSHEKSDKECCRIEFDILICFRRHPARFDLFQSLEYDCCQIKDFQNLNAFHGAFWIVLFFALFGSFYECEICEWNRSGYTRGTS